MRPGVNGDVLLVLHGSVEDAEIAEDGGAWREWRAGS